MDFGPVSVALPRGALWIRRTCRPANPLIELSLPEEETMKGVSSRLQKHGHGGSAWPLRLGLTQSALMLIPGSAGHRGEELFKVGSSPGPRPFIPLQRRGRASLHTLPFKVPSFPTHQFPTASSSAAGTALRTARRTSLLCT